MHTRAFAVAFIIAVLAGSAPAIADHGGACPDAYVCTSGGRVLSVSGTLSLEGGTATVTAEHHAGQRFSSEGHTETDSVSATVSLRLDDQPQTSCSPAADSLTFTASEIVNEIRVSSSAEGCSFDLVWSSGGTPGTPTAHRQTEIAPGVPPAFLAVAALSWTVSLNASVEGALLGQDASGSGVKRDHWYVGHVTRSV